MAAGDLLRVSRFTRDAGNADRIAVEWRELGATNVIVSTVRHSRIACGLPVWRVIGRMPIEAFAKWSAVEARRDAGKVRPDCHRDTDFTAKGGE